MLTPSRVILRRLAACLCLSAGLAMPKSVLAGPTWYQIELIVFARHNERDLSAEVWNVHPGAPDLSRTLELSRRIGRTEGSNAESLNLPYRRLASAELNLKPITSKLARSGQFRVLVHTAWQQPGFSNKRARPVHIRSAASGIETQPELKGWVKLSRARYLHMDVDLFLRAAETLAVQRPRPTGTGVLSTTVDSATEIALEAESPSGFRMRQSRRMRSKEIHYIDHPAMGIIVLATPVRRKPAPTIPPPVVPQTSSGSESQPVASGAPKP